MKWYESLYLGVGCERYIGRLRRKINRRRPHPPVYLIVLPGISPGKSSDKLPDISSDGEGAESATPMPEIIPSMQLMQKDYPADDMRVIGMAIQKKEAFEMLRAIIEDTWRSRRDLDVGAYLGV